MSDTNEWPTGWPVVLHATAGTLAGCGLSLHMCPACKAVVIENFMPEHKAWHAELDKRQSQPESGASPAAS